MWSIDAISDLREEVKSALGNMVGVEVIDYTATGRINPPVAITVPADPFMTPSDQFGAWDVAIQVILIPRGGENTANDMDDLIFRAVQVLEEFDVTAVSAPQNVEFTVAGKRVSYWGCILTIEFTTTINKESE